MNVSPGIQWEKFAAEKVESGRYQTASEVLRDGLWLIEQCERALDRIAFHTKGELEGKIEEGLKQLDVGRTISGPVAVKRLRERAVARGKSAPF